MVEGEKVMRSYEAARSYFGFLGFVSWCVIIIGAIVAIVSMTAFGQVSRAYGGSSMAGLAGMIPGVAIMFSGFMGLVIVQIGRAGVDSAEYTQQMLLLSREQLEISRHTLKQGPDGEQIYAAVQEALKKSNQLRPEDDFPDGSKKLNCETEFPKESSRMRYALELEGGKIIVNFFNGETAEYSGLEEAKKILA
ncbi:MAG: hypothetical protein ACK5NN_09400 [Sphingomonadaceae bacterium]